MLHVASFIAENKLLVLFLEATGGLNFARAAAILAAIACAVACVLALVETFVEKVFEEPRNQANTLCLLSAVACTSIKHF